jgi:hypothetical protein
VADDLFSVFGDSYVHMYVRQLADGKVPPHWLGREKRSARNVRVNLRQGMRPEWADATLSANLSGFLSICALLPTSQYQILASNPFSSRSGSQTCWASLLCILSAVHAATAASSKSSLPTPEGLLFKWSSMLGKKA